jgi:hypothetical protein
MFLAVIAVLAMGIATGVSMEQNVPAVDHFSDKYLCATCVPDEDTSK